MMWMASGWIIFFVNVVLAVAFSSPISFFCAGFMLTGVIEVTIEFFSKAKP